MRAIELLVLVVRVCSGELDARCFRESGELPLPKGERVGVRGSRTLDRPEPPDPHPLPCGERGPSVLAATFCINLSGTRSSLRALGIEVPTATLLRADEVVE
jgi:hypothetical protein